jgi:hypothetical protein
MNCSTLLSSWHPAATTYVSNVERGCRYPIRAKATGNMSVLAAALAAALEK